MDITILFKACVKTVRTTNKSLGLKESKSSILKSTQRDPNLVKAREILKQISSLKQLLIENKAAYLNVLNYLSTNKIMSDADREQIETSAQNIINSCNTLLKNYRNEISRNAKSKQREEHYLNVISTLDNYLKEVSKIYAEAKAMRVKKVIETHKISKLEMKQSPVPNGRVSLSENKVDKENTNDKKKEIVIPPSAPNSDIKSELSAEEMQMFQSENEFLYNELNSMSDEVSQMESKVVHIAELQELFTEKVLQQDKDIDRIATVVATSTDNIRDANDQIRQAIQRNVGLRVWVLFFLLVMSFSLLFLDWYND